MEHWFDRLAKDVASGNVSRRAMIGGIAATLAAAATTSEWPISLAAPVQKRPGAGIKIGPTRYGWRGGGAPMRSTGVRATASRACIKCYTKCNISSASEGASVAGCILSIFGFASPSNCYSATVGNAEKDQACLSKCNARGICFGSLCPGTHAASSLSPTASCGKHEVCVSPLLGYCCPASHPHPCPGLFRQVASDDLSQNFCCGADSTCLLDSASGTYTCCPKKDTSGKSVTVKPTGTQVGTAQYTSGYCCGAGTVADATGHCCAPHMMRNGKCCTGKRFCGEQCCNGPCRGGKCATLCLSQQWTTDGKCCNTGTACGKNCCQPGQKCVRGTCQTVNCPSRTSACKGSKSTTCCPEEYTCCYGACCDSRSQVCCTDINGVYGCRLKSQCGTQVIK